MVNGIKQFITTGKNADVAIVFALTDKSAGKKGISAFIVDTKAPGYIVARVEDKLGQRASDTAQIVFDNCEVPAANLLGREGGGYRIAMQPPEGDLFHLQGEFREVDPPRRLAYTFHPHHDGLEKEGPSRVTFDLEQQKDQVKLTVVHDGFEVGSEVFVHISRGWPHVLSSLKSYVEAGKGMRAPWYDEQCMQTAGAAR